MKKLLVILFALSLTSSFAQIENGLIAHFPLNNSVDDISLSSISASNNGCVFVDDRNGIPSYSIDVTTTSTFVSFNDNVVKPSLPFTISAWVNLDAFSSQYISPIFTSDNVWDDYYGYWLYVNSNGQVALSIGGGLGNPGSTNRRTFVTNNSISTGNWHHILVIVRAYNDMEIHVDCQNMAGSYTGTGSTNIVYSNADSRIGSHIGNPLVPNGHLYDGRIDQIAIWDRELTSEEIVFMCNTNNPLLVTELEVKDKELIKIVDLIGRETDIIPNTPLIYIYSDGTTEKVFRIEN